MLSFQLLEEWPTNTQIGWWNVSRGKLNKVIRKYNKWQLKKDFEVAYGIRLLAVIRHAKDTFGSQDGGGGYLEELVKMESFVVQVVGG